MDIGSNLDLQNERKVRRICILCFCLLGIFCSVFIMVLYHSTRNSTTEVVSSTNVTHLSNESEICSNYNMIFLGDGICDDFANTKACLFDLGDCCDSTNYTLSHATCFECFCHVNMSYFYGTLKDTCFEKVVPGDSKWTSDMGQVSH